MFHSVSIMTLPTKWISLLGDPLATRFSIGEAIGGEQIVAQHIGAEPVDLLRHAHVARAQSGLDMGHLDAELLGGDGAGHGRIDVADDDHQVGVFLRQTFSKAIMIRAVCSAWNPEPTSRLMSGRGMPRSSKEGLAHALVVVLAGMNSAVA